MLQSRPCSEMQLRSQSGVVSSHQHHDNCNSRGAALDSTSSIDDRCYNVLHNIDITWVQAADGNDRNWFPILLVCPELDVLTRSNHTSNDCSTFLGNVTNYHQLRLISTQPIVTPPPSPSPPAVSRELTRIFSHMSCFYRKYVQLLQKKHREEQRN